MNAPGEGFQQASTQPAPLPPFSPPADYAFERELLGPTPRAVPDELKQGGFARRRRAMTWGLVAAGLISIAAGQLPIVDEWGWYVLPLAYISWIGLGLVAIGMLTPVWGMISKGPYRYVEEGVPIVARIQALVKRAGAVVNGQPTGFQYAAVVECIDPSSGELREFAATSRNLTDEHHKRYTTSFRVGDYVTAIYLAGDPEKSLRLYGFLDLNPRLGVIDRSDYKPSGPLSWVAFVVALFGIFFSLGWFLHALGHYSPLEHDASQAVLGGIGAVLFGGAMLGGLAYATARRRRLRARANLEALQSGEALDVTPEGKRGWFGNHGILIGALIVCGALVIGGLAFVCLFFAANAWFDRSPVQLKPVHIVQLVQKTHRLVIREYIVEYEFVGEAPKKRSIVSNPTHMARFRHDLAVAHVRNGALGWPWVEAIEPAIIVPAQNVAPEQADAAEDASPPPDLAQPE
jgi:hypothetical protein